MKFNLSDFVQLDTKGLLAVNGGYYCNGSSNTTVYPNTYYPSSSSHTHTGGSSSGGKNDKNSDKPIKTIERLTGTWEYYADGSGVWTDNNGQKHPFGSVDHTKDSDTSSGKTSEQNGNGSGKNESGSSTHESSIDSYVAGLEAQAHTQHGGSSPDSVKPDVPQTGGSCSGKNTKISGKFGQITDGTYADELTMQKYSNDPYQYQPHLDEKMNGNGNTFSHQGCKMTAAAKIASELTGKDIDIYLEINQKWDSNKDGYLTEGEIASGLNDILDDTYGDIFDVQSGTKTDISSNELNNIVTTNNDIGTTFVLAKVNLGDVNNDGMDDYHWVVLEGYSKDSNGKITFSYDGTSDNDVGRTYVLGGQPDPGSKIGTVEELQTFTVIRK